MRCLDTLSPWTPWSIEGRKEQQSRVRDGVYYKEEVDRISVCTVFIRR